MIPFNKPFVSGNEFTYMMQSVQSGKISGDGLFTKKCHSFFQSSYNFHNCLLTTSCTHALEMCALLLDINPGDEVLLPSFTFVSTANAFILRGAKLIFVDSSPDSPNIDPLHLENLITSRTKAVVLVHYAGIPCDIDSVMELSRKHNFLVIEDAAQAIDAYVDERPLGSIGHLSAFSFHETKNIICGEGGMLVVNDERFVDRALVLREKGTNRQQYFRGLVSKYTWVDLGSSYLPSDLLAAYLYAQLECLPGIQKHRLTLWNRYYQQLSKILSGAEITLPFVPPNVRHNAHMFYLICESLEQRNRLIQWLKLNGVMAVFHYQSLHSSSYFSSRHDGRDLPHSDRYSSCLLRLPLYSELSISEVDFICGCVAEFFS